MNVEKLILKTKMVEEMRKKGDISSKWLVTIILLLIGFGIILILIFRFNIGEEVDRDVCHQSVVFRATLPSVAEDYIPLKCKTAKFCITSKTFGEGNCEEFKGEKGITKVNVGEGAEGEEDIERFLSRELAKCWSMMGEGKVSLFTQYWTKTLGVGTVYPTCIICSRIAFDKDSLEDAEINLENIDVLKYMLTHKVPNTDERYTDYFGGLVSVNDFNLNDIDEKKLEEPQKQDEENKQENNGLSDKSEQVTFQKPDDFSGNKEAKEMSVLFMQISAPSHSGVIKNTLVALGISYGSSAILAPKITARATVGLVKSWWFWAMAAVFGGYQQVNTAWNRAITAGYCGDVSVGGEAREGCSVVRSVEYNPEDITQYCKVIESIP